MKQNLGTVDRVLRFLLAFWWLGPFAPTAVGWLSWIIVIVGWIALFESFFCYCALKDILGLKPQ